MPALTVNRQPPPPFKKSSKLAVTLKLLALGPFAAGILILERRFSRVWRVPFPQGIADLERDPHRLATLLTTPSNGLLESPIPAGATPVAQRRLGTLANEPDKDRTTASWDVTVRAGGRDHTVRVLTKFQSGRGMPLYMQAIRAVVERQFHREVAFYRTLAPEVPVRVARPWFADGDTTVNRVCLVLEHIDAFNPADWRGCPLSGVRAMLASAAALNARYLNRTTEPSVAWIPARGGLDFAEFVELFLGKATPIVKQVWAALRRAFDDRPVTLVHGDCRPGNMLFVGGGLDRIEMPPRGVASAWPDGNALPDVVMSDWEAVNVAPLLWDFTYGVTIGLRAIDRRTWRDRLLDEFLSALAASGVDGRLIESRRARIEVDMLTMVLAYVALAVYENGLWQGQGNTAQDLAEWTDRLHHAVRDCDAATVAEALGLDAPTVAAWQGEIAARLAPRPQ